jgi:queuosine precursor transporter
MNNELLFLVSAVIGILFVYFSYLSARVWFVATIFVNLILIATWGAKVISLFGFPTNIGNAFYGCVFFATWLVVERFGKEIAYRVVWIGFALSAFFMLMSQLSLHYGGLPQSAAFNDASRIMFNFSPRIGLASMLGYMISQYFNIGVYSWIKEKTEGKKLWLQSIGASIVGQGADSIVFFTTAFFGVLSNSDLLMSIAIGWALKVGVGVLATPFLYMARNHKQPE